MSNDEREIITLNLECGETECEIVGIFDEGERQYAALLPVGRAEVIILRCFEEEADVAALENIEDDNEYAAASEAFKQLIG